jgi:hypothetical protein
MSAFGGKADMGGRIAAIVSAAFDPKLTLAPFVNNQRDCEVSR